MKEKLKPCPFCGCKDVIVHENKGLHAVFCNDCACGTWLDYPTSEKAIEVWNKRIEL